jgi:hypothetical protein
MNFPLWSPVRYRKAFNVDLKGWGVIGRVSDPDPD